MSTLTFPALDELTQKRLAELQFWPSIYGQLHRASVIAQSLSQSAQGSLLQGAITQLAQDNLAIAAAVKTFCQERHLTDSNFTKTSVSSPSKSDFKAICHQNNMGLLWMSGLYELAIQEDYLQADILAILDQILMLQARHILFFLNWLAFESHVKQKPEYELKGLLSFLPLKGLWFETFKKLNRSEYDDTLPIDPDESDYFLGKYGYSDFVQACESNYLARFTGYDERLVQPRTLLQAAKSVRTLLGFWPQRVNAVKAPST